ncbi:hypothetical protein [Niabella aquatica]
MDKELGILDEQGLKRAFVDFLSSKMAKADWYFDYSDDQRVWRNGFNEISEIKEELKLLSRLEGGLDEAKRLWKQHVPEYSVKAPSFFSNPELLNSVLGGCIMKKDISEVQGILDVMQRNGDRFIVFENDASVIPKERFIGFTTASDAHHFAYENSSPKRSYIIYSIACLQKDLKCATEPDIWKAYTLKELIDKMPNMGKDPHGQELSR